MCSLFWKRHLHLEARQKIIILLSFDNKIQLHLRSPADSNQQPKGHSGLLTASNQAFFHSSIFNANWESW